MAVKASLNLQIDEFEAKYRKAVADSKRYNNLMERDARDAGQAMGSGLSRGLSGVLAGAAGVLGAGAIFDQIRQQAEEAQQVLNVSDSVDESVDSLMRLRAATTSLNVDFEAATELSRELEDRLGDLGNSEPMEVLKRLGLEAETLIAMPIDEKVLALADAFQKSRVDGVAYSDLLKLVGDSVGEQLLPVITQTRAELEDMFGRAPEDAEEFVNQMARLNQMLNETGDSAKMAAGRVAGSMVGIGTFLKDVFQTGSLDKAFEMEGQRALEFAQERAGREEDRGKKAEAIKAARDTEQAQISEAAAAKDLADTLEKILDMREGIARGGIDLLPSAEKVDALKNLLQEKLSEATEGTIFQPTLTGLQSMADSEQKLAEDNDLGFEDTLAALELLDEAKSLESEILKLEEEIAKTKRDSAAAEAESLQNLRDEAAEGAFELLSPEEQAAELRDRLSDSLGFKVEGLEDVERGLATARAKADAAREAGDSEGEKAALEELNAAQEAAKDLAALGTEGGEEAVVNGRGTVAGAIANIFDRSSSELQLDEARAQTTLLGRIEQVLGRIETQNMEDDFETTFQNQSYP